MGVFEFLQLALSALIGAVSAWWATGKFQTESIWEKRFHAYTEIVVALGELLQVLGRWLEEGLGERRISGDAQKILGSRFREAKANLEKVTALAGLILPIDVYKALTRLQSHLNNNITDSDLVDVWARHFGVIEDALEEVRLRGRQELRRHFKLER